MDFNSLIKIYSDSSIKSRTVVLLLMTFFWIPFIASAHSYESTSWFLYLLYCRWILALIPIAALIFLLLKKQLSRNFESYYYLLAMVVQATHGYLEPSNQNDFYSYTSLFFLLSALCYHDTLKRWNYTFLPVVVLSHAIPLFFKDPEFFIGFGHFVDKFSFNVSLTILSLVIVRMAAAKFEMHSENISLHKKLLFEKQHHLDIVEAKLAAATAEIQSTAGIKAMSDLASQVSHDIRSPLAALTMLMGNLSEIPEEKRIMARNAINRSESVV